MRKSVFMPLLAVAILCACMSANADIMAIPDGIITIEDSAFESIADIDAVYIPGSVTNIDADAFSDSTLAVYGHAGSAAEQFAAVTNRRFVQVDITDIQLTSPGWVAPETPTVFTARAVSALFSLKFTFTAERNGVTVVKPDSNGALTFTEGGVYDIRVNASNGLAHESKLFESAVTVGEPVRFASDELLLGAGRTLDILSADETRSVALTVDKTGVVSIWGRTATGLKAGACVVKAVATQPEGSVTTYAVLRVYTPVTSVSLINAPARVFIGEQVQLSANVLPFNAEFKAVEWKSSNEQIATVSETGLLTALTQGECVITATADGVTYSHSLKSAVPVSSIDVLAPFSPLYTSGRIALTARVMPENADDKSVVWSSLNPSTARVDANGVVTGVSVGTAQILCTAADGSGVYGVVNVSVYQGVSDISLSLDKTHAYPNEKIQVEAITSPQNALDKTLSWSSDNESVATVDQNGLITTRAKGTVIISATAVNGVRSGVTLVVMSTDTPTSFTLNATNIYLNPGEKYKLVATPFPAGTEESGRWLSLNEKVAKIDQNGVVTAVSSGTVRVGIVSNTDSGAVGVCNVTVLNPTRTLVMPLRKTAISGIAANRTRISNVKKAAHNELSDLVKRGVITSSEASKRKSVIDAAFAMYDFPWMTLNRQPYWKAANSEGGVKDFQPGIVYYGMPYISNTYYNQRMYTPSKAVSENRYYLSGAGTYYILNQNNLLKGQYCGNDCSSMVAMCYKSYLPTNVALTDWNTTRFYETTAFKTISKSSELHPGDIMVKMYGHVVIFLYYANAERTQFVIIEQGGTEPGTNTTSTSVKSASEYASNYIYRRLQSWH